ncbi:MAG: hypothetical protein HYV09_00020 [Deltaproteobacteria bacterium]|nr:hypothetical protein [Deltaproteobacteria bacterium]
MREARVALCAVILALGCSDGGETSGPGDGGATDATLDAPADSAVASDSSTDAALDTAADTAATDSGSETAATDTASADTASADTASADTASADTAATDAASADTGSDSAATDTGAATVHYAADIQPIFDARCISCHSGAGSGGLVLSSGVSHGNLVNVAASCAPSTKRVAPGSPSDSMLWRKLSNDAAKCGSAMPLGTAGLKATQPALFAKIEAWILAGAPND